MAQQRSVPLEAVCAVTDGAELKKNCRKPSAMDFVHPTICSYIIELVNATRRHELVTLGLSTRGALAVTKLAKANAYIEGRSMCFRKMW